MPKAKPDTGRIKRLMVRAGLAVARAALVSAGVSVATLPVLILFSMPLSLLTLPVNILAVPLMGLLLPCCFFMALPVGVALVEFFVAPAAFVGGVLLVWLEALTDFCDRLPGVSISLSGGFALLAVLVVYGLVFLAVKTPYRKIYAVSALGALLLSVALHSAMERDTVHITLAGSGANASLVVSQGRQAVVLYRSRLSAGAVQRALRQSNTEEVVLFVDLRNTAESTEYLYLFAPEEVFIADRALAAGREFSPLPDVQLVLQQQGKGRVACVDVEGFKTGITVGAVDMSDYGPLDVLVAGGGKVQGDYDLLLVQGARPDWAAPQKGTLQSEGTAGLHQRPGKSIQIREADDGAFA